MRKSEAIYFERQPYWHPMFRAGAPATALMGLGAWAWNAWGADEGASFEQTAIGFFLAFAAAAIVLLYQRTALEVTVSAEGARIRFFPFAKKTIRAGEIRSVRVRRYSPGREFGGWGVRRGPEGSAFHVSGDRGVEVRTRDGQTTLIGSAQPERLAQAFESVMETDAEPVNTMVENHG